MKAFLGKTMSWVVFGVFVVGLAGCKDSGDPRFQKKYIVIPGARFVPGQETERAFPACSPDYPLFCGENNGCCPDGYAYGCPAQDRCFDSAPDAQCPGWVECTPPDIMITGISPHDAKLRPGQSVTAAVSFRYRSEVRLQKAVVQVGGVGEFEQEISEDQAAAGLVEIPIRIETQKPDLSACEQECSRTGACGPCFAETTLPFWTVHFLLADDAGKNAGTPFEWLSLSYDPSKPSGECNDISRCCVIDNCGGISCQVDAITVPASCGQCPAGTTYETTDVHNDLLMCSCDACAE